MHMLARPILTFIFPAGLVACNCGPGTWAPACETFYAARAVFLGTVLDHNDDGSGKFTQWTGYLVRVDEVFRGLDSSDKEVFIDPGSFTSCYTHYSINKQYLFVVGGQTNFLAMSVITEGRTSKTFPARWESKKDLRVYSSPGCSSTRDSTDAVADVSWLRARAKGETKTRVYGLALQNYDAFYRPPRLEVDMPLIGARITLTGDGRQFTTFADANGTYSFDGVPVGNYDIVAEKFPWEPSPHSQIELRTGGCAQRNLSLRSNGNVRGIVLDHTGKPISGLRLQLVKVLPGGTLSNEYSSWSDTDGVGHFNLKRVASGDFLLGVNIASAPTNTEPYPATFYPGVQEATQARRFQFEPNANVEDLTLRLPPPLVRRRVQVHVYWADGTPVTTGARAFANYQSYQAAFQGSKSGNTVELILMEDLDYSVRADWFGLPDVGSHHVVSDPVKLPAGRGPVTLDIKLKPRH
jgi:carboxypeptidase family protein